MNLKAVDYEALGCTDGGDAFPWHVHAKWDHPDATEAYVRRADVQRTGRGDAAAADIPWRRRRGYEATARTFRGRVAATPRPRRGYSVETGATPQVRRGLRARVHGRAL